MQEQISSMRARYFFDSLAQMQDWIARTSRTWKDCDSSITNPKEEYWDLCAGYDGAMAMARDGWVEGAAKAQKALKAFVPLTNAPDTVNDIYGYRPNVARFCSGVPDCMVRRAPRADNGAGRVLTLIVPVNALAGVSAVYMANFGVAVAQYINQMENDGTRVEIIAAMTSTVSDWRVSACARVKHADQPLDLSVLAFAIGHPAMFRRLGFAIRERCAAPRDYGYGNSIATRANDMINAPVGAVVLNGMKDADTHARTPEAALAYVEAQITKALVAQKLGN